MNKKKLVEAKLLRQQEIVDTAKNAGRNLTAQEQAEFDVLQRDIETLNSEIAAEERAAAANKSSQDADNQRAVEQERERIRQVRSLCEEFGMEAASYIDSGATVDQVREAALNHVRANRAPVASRGVDVIESAEDKFRAAASDALLLRNGININNPHDGAMQMRSMSLRDLAIECLLRDGESNLNLKSSDELFMLLQRQFYNPTAAFPSILDNTINKAYVDGHKKAAVTFDRWTTKGSLKDFKTSENTYLAGPAGEFLEVPEGGELKHDTFSDEKRPTRRLKTYGRQFTLTRQAFINDDIDLITKIPAKYAASARKTINKQVYKILVDNPAVYDGTALFSSLHRNLLASGTGITRESMQKMIIALQNQTDEFGEAIIVRPATLIVPSGMGFDIFTIFNSPTINTSGNTQAVNPLFKYASSIEIVEEPTLNVLSGGYGNTMPWFLIGHSDDTDFIQVDYLNGQDIPTIRRMETPGQLGFVWDIYLDWGVAVMDWRGAVRNSGAVVADPLA